MKPYITVTHVMGSHMLIRKALLITALLLAGGCAQARSHATCTPEQAQAADAAVDTLDSWKSVGSFFTRYRHCDDGSIAEGSSEAIARLLVDHWDRLPELSQLIAGTPALRPFVLRHINTTLDTADLQKLGHLATTQCPQGSETLCKALDQAAHQAAGR